MNTASVAKASHLERLTGFDAAKSSSVTSDIFKEVLEERKQKAKAQAKEQLIKALTLREQMAQARRKFEQEWEKSDKELGKVVNCLHSVLNGRPTSTDTEETVESTTAAHAHDVVG